VDHLSAASDSDPALLAARERAALLASQSAFPALHAASASSGGFVPEEEDEEFDEAKLRAQMAALALAEDAQAAQEARPLTLELIRQRCLPREVLDADDPKLVDSALMRLERAHLDGLSLSSVDDCFDLLSHCLSHVYLQRNQLSSTLGFSALRNLRFLMLAHNRIRVLEGLEKLENLQFLDVSHNLIDELDTGSADDDEDTCQLPASLVVLRVAGNPFISEADEETRAEIQEHIVTVSPYLQLLDNVRITNEMRRSYGLEVDDEDDEDAASDPFSFALQSDAAAARKGADDGEEEGEEEEDDAAALELEEADRAAASLRAETDAMRQRSEQRTKQFDDKHHVSEAQTAQDRVEALEAAAKAGRAGK